MKKIISFIAVFALILSLAACGSEIKKIEKEYVEKIELYISENDHVNALKTVKEALEKAPESEKFNELLMQVNDMVPTEEEIKANFIEYQRLLDKWFEFAFRTVSHSDTPYKVVGEDEFSSVSSYLVTEEGIKTKADLEALFTQYCTKEVFDELSPDLGTYEDIDGKLCLSMIFGGMEGTVDFDKYSVDVKKVSDEDFEVTYLILYTGGMEGAAKASCFCSKGKDGYKFGKESRQDIYSDYVKVNISAPTASIEAKEFPHDSAETAFSFSTETSCHAVVEVDGWTYIQDDDGNGGWIKSEYIEILTEEGTQDGSQNNKPSGGRGASVGDVVGGVVDAGIGFAAGVLNSIF